MGRHARGGTRRPGGRPDGVPLGRAFLIGPGLANEPLREAVDIVAGVHGDGDLPTIPVVWDTSLDARARFVIRDALPSAIAVRPGDALVVPIVHEIGHFLDFAAIDGFGAFASLESARFDEWQTSVNETATFRTLSQAVDQALPKVPRERSMRRRRIARLRSPEEVWARSYTQYVIGRSGRADLAADLESERFWTVEGVVCPLHWEASEFRAIDDAIERLFRSLGWRRS
jgi:hypothetical protein